MASLVILQWLDKSFVSLIITSTRNGVWGGGTSGRKRRHKLSKKGLRKGRGGDSFLLGGGGWIELKILIVQIPIEFQYLKTMDQFFLLATSILFDYKGLWYFY